MKLLNTVFYLGALSLFYQPSLQAEISDKNTQKEALASEISLLSDLSLEVTKRHEKALSFLKEGDEASAKILLQKNFYQNLFFPSYRVLKSINHAPSLTPFLWHLAASFFGLFSLFWLVFSLKDFIRFKKNKKRLLTWLCALTILFISGFFSLKERGSLLQDAPLLNAPFEKALSLKILSKGTDLVIVKTKEDWIQVKTPQQQIGWLLKNQLLKTLE